MTNTRLLELWGETLLEAARVSKGSQAFFDIFQNGYAARTDKASQSYKRFAEDCRDAFGKEGIEAFNSVMQEYFTEPYPARAALGVASLPKGVDIEAEAVLRL